MLMFIHTLTLFICGSLLLSAGCTRQPEKAFLEQDVLRIKQLPSSVSFIDSNDVTGIIFGIREYWLHISPEDYAVLVSGRQYVPCAVQEIDSHEAFSSLAESPNIHLTHCVKSGDAKSSVAIYRDSASSHVFITYDKYAPGGTP